MKKKVFHPLLLLFLGLFFVFSCGKKIPPEWKALEGTWQNDVVYMKLSEDGGFSYKRQENGTSVSIETWVTEYRDDGFSASTLFGETDFVIDKKPFFNQETKTTQMVVDGRTLTKQIIW